MTTLWRRALIGAASALAIGVLAALPGSLASAATGPAAPRPSQAVAATALPGCQYPSLGGFRAPTTPCPLRSSSICPSPKASSYLSAVSAVSPSDAWAVGGHATARGVGGSQILRWNGTGWKVVPWRSSAASTIGLLAISAISATDAWAVGVAGNHRNSDEQTLILHWNGTQWTRVSSPNPSTSQNVLYAVTAVSASDAWAVGQEFGGKDKTLILHWNGTSWTHVPSPSPGGGQYLTGVSGTSAASAWAVGVDASSSTGWKLRSLILHWNGTRWVQTPTPKPTTGGATAVLAVSSVSPADAWATGYSAASTGRGYSLTLHWNGVAWARVPSPTPRGHAAILTGVSANSPASAWAAGYNERITSLGLIAYAPLILRWNGTSWTRVPSPKPTYIVQLNGISAASATSAWGVGSFEKDLGYCPGLGTDIYQTKAIALQWNGTRWTRVTTPG